MHQVDAKIIEPHRELEIEHDIDQRRTQAIASRVIRAIRRRTIVEVFGRRGRPHEQAPIVEVRTVQQLRRHRVEERLGTLGLPVVDQQADEATLHLRPERITAAV